MQERNIICKSCSWLLATEQQDKKYTKMVITKIENFVRCHSNIVTELYRVVLSTLCRNGGQGLFRISLIPHLKGVRIICLLGMKLFLSLDQTFQ